MPAGTKFAIKASENHAMLNMYRMDVALKDYLENGGTVRGVLEMLWQPKKNRRDMITVAAEIMNEWQYTEKGQSSGADKAGVTLPDSVTDEKGQFIDADKAKLRLPDSTGNGKAEEYVVPPPGHSKRGLKQTKAFAKSLSKSLFETYKLPDGTAIGDVQYSNAPHRARKHRFASRIIMSLYNKCVPADQNSCFKDYLTEADATEAFNSVEAFNDIH